MGFKIAVDAGHGLTTAGKRVDPSLDAKQTKEWTLNNRVAKCFMEAAGAYADVQLLRVDDTTGKTDIPLADRCKKANDWGADLYLSIHHNAGINLGTGGGIVAYSYKEGSTAAKFRDAIYRACISAGGLKGNRADPLLTADFYVLKHTKAPAVLMEYGFMDSAVDAPVILTEAYARLVANATMSAIAELAGITQKITREISLPELKKGAKGETVKALQILLTGYGFPCGSYGADGDFGNATEQAVRTYQEKMGLAVDGIIGVNGWRKLLGIM